ncbi:MAG: fumarylacetoacetase, partial [Bacteroidetes bacterium]
MINANNPDLTSWVPVSENSDFPIQNIPFGIFSTSTKSKRAGIAIGDQVLDLFEIASAGLLNQVEKDPSIFNNAYLNPIIDKGKAYTRALRNLISEILEKSNPVLRDNDDLRKRSLIPMTDVTMHLQVNVGDYTDFYSSKDHATNVGIMFRDP